MSPSTLKSLSLLLLIDVLFFVWSVMKDVIDTAYVADVDCGDLCESLSEKWILDSSLMLEMPIFVHTRFTNFLSAFAGFWGLLFAFVSCISRYSLYF
jgi:hypothetical protein